MKVKIKIGIIGCGTIANVHAEAINQSNKTKLHSVFSRNKEKAKKCAGNYGITAYTNWNEFISDSDLDAVSICTPSGTHLDYGVKAAKAGKHVIVEKPIEVTLQRAKTLIDECEKNNVKLAVIYQSRFSPEISDLKNKIERNILGDIFMADAFIKWYRNQDYYDSGIWRGTIKLDGGGVLINQAIHTIDLLQWLVGDIETVYGKIGTFTHKNIEGEDNAAAVIKYKTGAIGVIEASTSVQPAQSRKIELHGKQGTIVVDDNNVEFFLVGREQKQSEVKENKSSGASSPLSGFSIEPHKNQFEAISNAILNNQFPPVSGAESLKSLAIVQAIYESSKLNAPVVLDELLKRE